MAHFLMPWDCSIRDRDVEVQHVAWRHSEILLGGNAGRPNQKSVLVAKAKAAPTPVRLTTRADTNSEQTTRDPRPVPEVRFDRVR